jgi:hypothetical protein
MVMLVHLTPESSLSRIRRAGIRAQRPYGGYPGGVFAVPVGPNFVVSHQWLRELRRSHPGPLAGVYFRVPDDELLFVGHYRGPQQWRAAAVAAKVIREAADPLGWQCVVPRRIEAHEIHRCRRLPQGIGWRYFPGSHGKRPMCACDYCIRGEYGANKLRARLGDPRDR